MGPIRTVLSWQSVVDALEAAASDSRSSTRLKVLDLGGGTGSDAVQVAALGHEVVVVDPSPDALAASARRATESGVQVTGLLGDTSTLVNLVEPGSFDLVICHGVLEHVNDPAEALQAARGVLRAHGWLSVLVAGRVAAVAARAAAGDFAGASVLVSAVPDASWDFASLGPRRWLQGELDELVSAQGFTPKISQGVRVFADHLPAGIADSAPEARQELLDLELQVRRIGEFTGHSGGLQTIGCLES